MTAESVIGDIEPTLRRPTDELGPRAQRTVVRILAATRDVFLTQGYGGTSIDDIAQRAGVSRASFYTYFPTKRDALLALGNDATAGAGALVDELGRIEPPVEFATLEAWIGAYLAFLDEYGGFALAWGHAAYEDDELRVAGTRGHLRLCRRLGDALESLRGAPVGDATTQGLLLFSMLERGWAQARLYEGAIDMGQLRRDATDVLARMVGTPCAREHR
ncbi:MAG TPA: TetR/AcrR family transcriptional regulator [Acidimicrobiia bacterium]|nr:TetR/AcrR family transcriptional regulator [Acidimicrobiia bacterium]